MADLKTQSLPFPAFENYLDKTDYILKAIMNRYDSDRDQWAFIVELRMGTGFGGWNEKSIDVFVINCYPSKGNHKIAFEIKTSRSDFLAEIKKPLKRHPALMISNEFYFAAPIGMIKPQEIPIEAGLIEIGMNSKFCLTLPAPIREAYPPTWPLVASIARRLNRAEKEKARE